MSKTTVDLSVLYGKENGGTAKLSDLSQYLERVAKMVKAGDEVTLTGAAPVWLYLVISHALHGKVVRLSYDSPVTGEIEIFNHNPF